MKTTFETEDEKAFLEDILQSTILRTDKIFEIIAKEPVKQAGYVLHLIELREKCFEYLNETDKKKNLLDKVKKRLLKEPKKKEPS